MKKKMLCVALIVALCLSSCGKGVDLDQPGYGKWRNSDIKGTVTMQEEIRPEDDFGAAANQEILADKQFTGSYFRTVSATLLQRKKELLAGEAKDEKTEQLKRFADLASDWEGRNQDGVEPLRPYVQAIEEISSMKDLDRYLADTEKNPFGMGILIPSGTTQSSADPTIYQVVIDISNYSLGSPDEYFELSDRGLESQDYTNQLTRHILGKLGYKDKDIAEILKSNYRFEKKMARRDTEISDDEMEKILLTRKECIKAAGRYPLKDVLDAWGYSDQAKYFLNKQDAKNMASIYKESNLKDIRGMLLVHTVLNAARYLDRETFDLEKKLAQGSLTDPTDTETTVPPTPAEEAASKEEEELRIIIDDYISKGALAPILDELYVKKYVSENDLKDLTEMTREIIEKYRGLFQEESWLSERGKKACIAKLDEIKPHILVPDFDMMDYSGLRILSKEEGGNFLRAQAEAEKCVKAHYAALALTPYDRSKWDPLTISTTAVNALYMPQANGIFILSGIAIDPIYRSDMTYEEKLAGIGTIVGHEITHGFDKTGCTYDKDGLKGNWLPVQDQMKFADRSDKVAEYYSTIHPFQDSTICNGPLLKDEATADMGGIRITLLAAADRQGFDYDRYFRQYAHIWAKSVTEKEERKTLEEDMHPLAYLRINVGLQQFDEFVKTYGIKEGDGMYLPKDKRIAVW